MVSHFNQHSSGHETPRLCLVREILEIFSLSYYLVLVMRPTPFHFSSYIAGIIAGIMEGSSFVSCYGYESSSLVIGQSSFRLF